MKFCSGSGIGGSTPNSRVSKWECIAKEQRVRGRWMKITKRECQRYTGKLCRQTRVIRQHLGLVEDEESNQVRRMEVLTKPT